MRTGEQIIPLTVKDRKYLWKQLRFRMIVNGLYFFSGLFLLTATLLKYNHYYFKFWVGAAIVCFLILLVLRLFERHTNDVFRLWKDLQMDKKRVVFGIIDQMHLVEHQRAELPVVTYHIGAYHFTLGQNSTALRRFREVMPGQAVELHQCLYTGIVLKIKATDSN